MAVRAFLPERNEPWGLARAVLREALAMDLEAAQVIPDRAAQALADVVPELEELRPIGRGVVDPESRRALALEAGARELEADPRLRAVLLRTRAEARALSGDLVGARDDLRMALPSLPRGPERSGALARIAEITSALDDYDQAGDSIELALAEAGDDRRARAQALTVAAFLDANRMEIDKGEARAAEALVLFEELGEPAGVASVVDLRAMAAFFRGRLTEAAALFDRASRLFRDTGQLMKVGSPWATGAWLQRAAPAPGRGQDGRP